MDISSVGYDLIVLWKVLSRTARLYTGFFLVSVAYASYSLGRVFIGLGSSRERSAFARAERRIATSKLSCYFCFYLE